MMQQKIEAAAALPTLHTAACEMEEIAGDLGDIGALLFALADRSKDWEFDPRALRGALLALEKVKAQAEAQSAALLEAHRATMPVEN